MIQSIWVQNQNGDRLDLSLTDSGFEHGLVVFSLEGLGSPKADVNGEGGPGFDGIRVNSVTGGSRQIILTLAIQGTGSAEETARDMIYQYFPFKQEVVFGVNTDRYELSIPAIVENCEMNHFAQIENAVISLLCPQPYLMDASPWEYSFDVNSGVPIFQFPFSNESLTEPLIEFGYDNSLPSGSIVYTSGIATGCDIEMEFSGTVDVITITNSNGGQSMTVDAAGGDGDRIVINTRVGEKSIHWIENGVAYNILHLVGIDDDWIEIRPGLNIITVTADTGQDLITTGVRFHPLRGGV